tara:strand:+ start:3293 stop:3943 length:651 start_codon:yes stop_codon:yes gene_type:complete
MYIKLILFIAFIVFYESKVFCVEENIVFLTVKKGTQDTTRPVPGFENRDNYLASLEERNGVLRENREVSPTGFSFDFYKINGNFSSGFGVELHNFKKTFSFENNKSKVSLSAVGLLYGLNFYYRGDYWFPFIGFGSGNISAKVKEQLITEELETNATVFDQVDKPFYYKFGVRIPLYGFGILISKKYISANMKVNTENKNLSLGGIGTFLGIYYSL